MASIKKRTDGRYRARYRDADGREHAKHFGRKIDAQRWLDEVTASVVTGSYVDPRAGQVTLRAFATGWEASQVGSPAAARIIDNALRVHILPSLGDRQIRTVRRSDVQSLVKQLSGQLAPGSVRNVYEVLAKVTAAAVFDRVIGVDPCERILLPKLADEEVVPPTVEQVTKLAATIAPRFRAAVVLLAGSGLRIGELLGLRVSDVDFLRRTVRVERQRLQNGKLAPPKTARSVRTIPIGHVVVDELAAHLAAHPSDEWLFTDEQGRPVPYWSWKRTWTTALTAAWPKDAEGKSTAPDITTHDLRHFYASALIAGGASVKQVQSVLGHSTAVITLRVYSHLWPGDEDRTRSIADAALGVLRTGCGPNDLASSSAAGQIG